MIERMIALRRLRFMGIQDRHFREWRFSDAEDTEVIQKARQYVANWNRARSENIGLLFWGGVGTGKTLAAACIANALMSTETIRAICEVLKCSVEDVVVYVPDKDEGEGE